MKSYLDLRKLNKAFIVFVRCRIRRYRTRNYAVRAAMLLILFTGGCVFTVSASAEKDEIDMVSVAAKPVIVNAAEPETEDTLIGSGTAEPEILYKADRTKYATSHIEKIPGEYAMSHNDEEISVEALTTEALLLSDLYVESGSIAVFKCYYPDALEYVWEIYDPDADKWQEVKAEDVIETTDELYRQISTFLVTPNEENKDQKVQCKVNHKSGENTTDTATLHILPDIESISVDEYISEAGNYVSARDIPIRVSYKNGSEDTITGLNGLYFLKKEESTEESTTVSGSMTETITTVLTTCEYDYLEGDKDEILRYQRRGENIDIPIRLIGEDSTPPEIKELSIGEFEISTVDQPVPVTVTIVAEDDVTTYQDLEYAFLPEEEELTEAAWTEQSSFVADITKNGKWAAYCRDKSGNIAKEEKDIIVVDNKAPTVQLSLENDTWCTENIILVNAKDGLSIEYCYSCSQTGEDSGWITKNEHVVTENGTWKVKVRDSVGNMAEEEIIIDNIDSQAPVIRGITEKKEKEEEIDN